VARGLRGLRSSDEMGVELAKEGAGLGAGRCEPELRVEWNQIVRASWAGEERKCLVSSRW
jgi:hypothetical protein